MNILYVYAHPNAASFNHVLKDNALEVLQEANHVIKLSDLYAEQFIAVASWNDFSLANTELPSQYFMAQKIAYDKHALGEDIKTEIEKIKWADYIIFQFPLWWFSMPAILKVWLDRILLKGFAYDAGKVFANGLLKGKTAVLIVTTQSPEQAFQLDGVHGCTIATFLHPIHHALKFVGMQNLTPLVIFDAFDIDEQEKINILNRSQDYLENLKI